MADSELTKKEKTKTKSKKPAEPKSLDIFPYLILRIYPDGTASGQKLLKVSEEHVEAQAAAELVKAEARVSFLKEWIHARHWKPAAYEIYT